MCCMRKKFVAATCIEGVNPSIRPDRRSASARLSPGKDMSVSVNKRG